MGTAVASPSGRLPVVLESEIRIPPWVVDLESFRRWARSDDFPERGRFSYLAGELWVDLSMEQLFTHNRVKTQFTIVVGGLIESEQRGYFFSDRVLFSNPVADLSPDPDASCISFDGIRKGSVRLIEGKHGGYIELEGTPDIVLEITSKSSVHKDTDVLRDLYWRAAIPEYWLVHARGTSLQFDILRRAAKGYVTTRRKDGWIKSAILGHEFRLTQRTDSPGNPQYTLHVKSQS